MIATIVRLILGEPPKYRIRCCGRTGPPHPLADAEELATWHRAMNHPDYAAELVPA